MTPRGSGIVTEAAVKKGEYQSRYDEIAKLYEGIEGANIEQELTADLVGDYLFSDEDFIRRLSTENRSLFDKLRDEIKYLCKVATAGSKELKELEKAKKLFEKVYREAEAKINTADEGGVRYSLNIQHSNGTVEELADARNITDEQVLSYLAKAKTGELKGHTYIPVRKDTPQVIIDTLKQVGENVDNLSLVMSVNKARQAMSNKDKSGVSKNKSDNIRGHSLKPEEILEIIKGLDEPSLMIYQTERYDKNGKELPNNVAVFVEFNNGENEGMAVVEFDSEFDNYTIGNEFGETQYHTVVTVFEPDTIRNGEEYDYAQELLENPNNIELEIRRRQPNESATREKHPNTFKELPSSTDSIPNSTKNVKQNSKKSLSSPNTAPKKYGNYNVYGEDVMLEGEVKPKGKAEITAPTRESIAEGMKKAITDAPMRADVNPIKNEQVEGSEAVEPVETTVIKTVEDRISAKIENSKEELSNNQRLLEESNADFDRRIAEAGAEYDAKKNKNTKVANNILRRIETLKRRKGKSYLCFI